MRFLSTFSHEFITSQLQIHAQVPALQLKSQLHSQSTQFLSMFSPSNQLGGCLGDHLTHFSDLDTVHLGLALPW